MAKLPPSESNSPRVEIDVNRVDFLKLFEEHSSGKSRLDSSKTAKEKLSHEKVERKKQFRELQRVFFWCALSVLFIVVLGSLAGMGLYMKSEWGRINPTVMIAWFGSVVAEIIGISYIIAAHLFPKRQDKANPASNSQAG